jgi:Uma2 family endonuclease
LENTRAFSRQTLPPTFVSPFDVRLPSASQADREINTVVQPDISLVYDPDKLKDNHGRLGAPDWVIEVLSPGTAMRDQRTKRALYERHAVAEIFVDLPPFDINA